MYISFVALPFFFLFFFLWFVVISRAKFTDCIWRISDESSFCSVAAGALSGGREEGGWWRSYEVCQQDILFV